MLKINKDFKPVEEDPTCVTPEHDVYANDPFLPNRKNWVERSYRFDKYNKYKPIHEYVKDYEHIEMNDPYIMDDIKGYLPFGDLPF